MSSFNSMYSIFFLFFVMNLLSFDQDNNATLTGKWKLIRYYNLTLGTSESEPVNIPRSIVVEFSDTGHIGKMNGHTVTNSVFGDYELIKENKIKILSFGGTKVAESKWGNKFWGAIHSVSSYKIDNNKLFLFFNGENERMELTKNNLNI